ncbi:MAG: hypothetical protein JWM28_1507 [Chitinophagaceae bacterium]|nr:hypothetical protein [Chitinophagaceae bacterium]
MKFLKKTFNERNLVIILFVMVFATFSFAQKESKKIEKLYLGFKVHNVFFPQFTSADKAGDTKLRKPESRKEYNN